MQEQHLQQLLFNLFHFHKIIKALNCDGDDQMVAQGDVHAALASIGAERQQDDAFFESLPSYDAPEDIANIKDVCVWFRDSQTQVPMSTENTASKMPTESAVPTPRESGADHGVDTAVDADAASGSMAAEGGTPAGKDDAAAATPEYSADAFNTLEMAITGLVREPAAMFQLYTEIDVDRAMSVSLGAVGEHVAKNYPLLSSASALELAYTHTCGDEGGDGDKWVKPQDFPQLLLNMFYYNKVFQCCANVDRDSNNLIDEEEFQGLLANVDMDLGEEGSQAAFQDVDTEASGMVPFAKVCVWYTEQVAPTPQEFEESQAKFMATFDATYKSDGESDAAGNDADIPSIEVSTVDTGAQDTLNGAGTIGTIAEPEGGGDDGSAQDADVASVSVDEQADSGNVDDGSASAGNPDDDDDDDDVEV